MAQLPQQPLVCLDETLNGITKLWFVQCNSESSTWKSSFLLNISTDHVKLPLHFSKKGTEKPNNENIQIKIFRDVKTLYFTFPSEQTEFCCGNFVPLVERAIIDLPVSDTNTIRGIQDCVRGFFCGGGIKHWEYGDNPLTEHARWYPNCAYVKQCREMANFQRRQVADEVSSGRQTSSSLQTPGTITEEDLRIEDLNSETAAIVLRMGYSRGEAEDAKKHARIKFGRAELRAQYLLEYLLDHQRTAASLIAPKPKQNVAKNNEKDKNLGTNTTNVSEKEQNLSEENTQLREQMLCKICMDKEANIVFLPCGHLVSCVECAHALRKCAVCRALIQRTVRTYR